MVNNLAFIRLLSIFAIFPIFPILPILIATLFMAKGAHAEKLSEKSYKQILDSYTFTGDFFKKEEERPISKREVFWRYPIKIPHVKFPYDKSLRYNLPPEELLPVTQSMGDSSDRAIAHMNRGRLLYIKGDYQKARDTWLSAIQQYGKDNPYHRRLDYFIALAFEALVEKRTDQVGIKTGYNNAAAYYSWAFQVKKYIPDKVLDERTPYHLYNLAAIYYNFGRYGGSFSIASEGLDWLRKNGRSDFRPKLHRILAEAFIRNRTFLRAVQEYDIILRENNLNRQDAAAVFARVGDIYFDLNNFELAEDAYRLAISIDLEDDVVNPSQYMLRGESLFWLGKFSLAQKMFHYALSASGRKIGAKEDSALQRVSVLPDKLAAVASIRMADAFLVKVDLDQIKNKKEHFEKVTDKYKKAPRGTHKKAALKKKMVSAEKDYRKALHPLEKAKIGYNRHIREFPMDHTADHARIRLACLNLPTYEGENINHARKLLTSLRSGKRANELAITPIPEAKPQEEKTLQDSRKDAAKPTDAKEAKGKGKDKEEESLPEPERVPIEDHMPALPQKAIHMAWGCEMASYAQHDRDESMVARTKEFVKRYPKSSYIRRLVEPVKKIQAQTLTGYLNKGDIYSAAAFFEKNRALLFQKVPEKLAMELFSVFVDVHKSQAAEEFYKAFKKGRKSGKDWLRIAVFSAETSSKNRALRKRNQKVAERMRLSRFTPKNTPQVRLYLDRIINARYASDHYEWILDLANSWMKKDSTIACELTYPLLSKIWNSGQHAITLKKGVLNRLDELMSKNLNELIQFETYCGYSLLEFELNVYAEKPLKIYKKLMARDFLPINRVTGNIFWAASEMLYKNGQLREAATLWKRLSDSNEAGVKEVQFAKVRLEKTKTELENLWQ